MNNLVFIPIRSGSKSIKDKNIKLINGKPLFYWIINACEKSKCVDKIIISTDSERYSEFIKSFEFEKTEIFHRNKEFATDTASTEDAILEFLNKKEIKDECVIILAQATSPLTKSTDIDNAFLLHQETKKDIISVAAIKRFIWSDDGEPLNYQMNSRPRRQDFDGLNVENGAIYISTCKKIKESKQRISGKIELYKMEEETFHELDEQLDFDIISNILSKRENSVLKSTHKIKLFVSDIDGVLTDSGMYYNEQGEFLKKFNTRDGMAFEILKKRGVKTALITSENSQINIERFKKLNIDFIEQNKKYGGKLNALLNIIKKMKIKLNEVAYIGDDINCKEILENVGISACPSDAHSDIKKIESINILNSKGGHGVVREFLDFLIKNELA